MTSTSEESDEAGHGRGWLVITEDEMDAEDDVLSAWKLEHRDFLRWTEEWARASLGAFIMADNSGDIDYGCPSLVTFLFSTEEAARAFGAREPVVSSGVRPIEEVCWLNFGAEADSDAVDAVDGLLEDENRSTELRTATNARVVVLPIREGTEGLLEQCVRTLRGA